MRILAQQKDREGRTRFFVLPVESEASFGALVDFVCHEFGAQTIASSEGPGTIVRRLIVDEQTLVFVLSDGTGTQFYAECEESLELASHVAKSVETRLRELLSG